MPGRDRAPVAAGRHHIAIELAKQFAHQLRKLTAICGAHCPLRNLKLSSLSESECKGSVAAYQSSARRKLPIPVWSRRQCRARAE